MATLTNDHLKAEQLCKDAIRSINNGTRAQIIKHLTNLQSEENERLISHTDTVRMFRAQGAITALQTIIELVADISDVRPGT